MPFSHQRCADGRPEETRENIGLVQIQEDLGAFSLTGGVSDRDMQQTGGDGVAATNEETDDRQEHPTYGTLGSQSPVAHGHDV